MGTSIVDADLANEFAGSMDQDSEGRALYETMVRRCARDLYRFAFRLCGHAQTAEDLVQDTFFEAWRSIGSLEDDETGRAWLFGVLRHRYAHLVRDGGRRWQLPLSLDRVKDEPSQPCLDVLDQMANQEMLQRALDALDDNYKVPFLMVFDGGLTCQKVAEHLQVPLGTVLSRIHRARNFLRNFLRRLDSDLARGLNDDAGMKHHRRGDEK
jgi:RNA polymerase sigma-70 factor, ECF subfamily